MTFDRQCLSHVGGGLAGYVAPEDQRAYTVFLRRNFEYYRSMENRAGAAVLHFFATLGFQQRPAGRQHQLDSGQGALRHRLRRQPPDLSKYWVLISAEQEYLSEELMTRVGEFVKQSGGLMNHRTHDVVYAVAAEKARVWAKRSAKFEAPPWRETEDNEAEALLKIFPVRN
jgi:hypothetical protein